MKTPVILSFAAGTACGALGFWLLQPAPPAGANSIATAAPAARNGGETKSFAPGAIAGKTKKDPEKEVTAANPGDTLKAVKDLIGGNTEWQEMMRKTGEREVNREVDRLALRLNLSDDQKQKLRKFLMDRKERELARMEASMKTGETPPETAAGPSKDDFLKDLLSDEQDAEYAKSQQEDKTARAEDYAQRKIRKLDRDLNLTPQQEDALFQAFAQRKLTEPDPVAGNTMAFQSGDGAIGHMSIAIAGDSGGGIAEPIEIELPEQLEFLSGSDNKDRELLEPILTPEQLAAYDKQRKEQTEQIKTLSIPQITKETKEVIRR